MCFTMIFRLKNFHSAGKVPCDGVASSIPPGKFFATASQAFCRLESSLRRRRKRSATRKVLCDGVANLLPRGGYFFNIKKYENTTFTPAFALSPACSGSGTGLYT